jgi:hypothetical protein
MNYFVVANGIFFSQEQYVHCTTFMSFELHRLANEYDKFILLMLTI